MKYVGNTDVFIFGFNFISTKWTRTKLIFVVTLPNRPNDAYCLYRGAMGSSAHILKFSFESALFSLSMTMRILFSTFRFANFIFSVLKCEADNFDKYRLACANGMFISKSWHANNPAQYAHDVTAHVVTRGMTWAMFSLHMNKIGPTFHVCCM